MAPFVFGAPLRWQRQSSKCFRPISDGPSPTFKRHIDLDLKPLLTTVFRDIVNIDKEVQDEQGRWYRLQIRPYRTLDNRIDGATLVLLDIDGMKKLNQELIDTAEFTQSIVETMPEPVLVLTSDLRVRLANQAFYDCFRVKPATTVNQFIYSLGTGQWNKSELRNLLEEILPQRKDFAGHEVQYALSGYRHQNLLTERTLHEPGFGHSAIDPVGSVRYHTL